MGDGGGGHWLVRMEWCPAGWLVSLPLLIFPCAIKNQKFCSGTGSPGWPRKKGRKTVVVVWWLSLTVIGAASPMYGIFAQVLQIAGRAITQVGRLGMNLDYSIVQY